MKQEAVRHDGSPGPEADEFAAGGYFPFEYHADFIRFLKERPHLFQVITYADLEWGDDFDGARGYPGERARWQAALRNGTRDPGKIHILVQHDVDSRAERAVRLVQEEARLGVPTNVMIFSRRHNRRRLREEGELSFTEYPVDRELLQRLCRHEGFVVGYHCNAHEHALFDMKRAQCVFAEHVADLRCDFPIDFFSAHGGVPGNDGKNNRDIVVPPALARGIRWVHNGMSPYFDGHYSDGGIKSPRRDPEGRDLRVFVQAMRRGRRYRVLTHPQYYGSPASAPERLRGTAWYEEILAHYARPGAASIWDSVRVPG